MKLDLLSSRRSSRRPEGRRPSRPLHTRLLTLLLLPLLLTGGIPAGAQNDSQDVQTVPSAAEATSSRYEGRPIESIDVRRRVGIQIVFEVIEQRHRFVPGFTLTSDQGQMIFNAIDTDTRWRQPQPPGVYTTTGWIPPNLLNEGMISVAVALGTFVPGGRTIRQAHVNDAVAFQVVDPGEGDTARGDYPGVWTSPVRPLLEWSFSRRDR